MASLDSIGGLGTGAISANAAAALSPSVAAPAPVETKTSAASIQGAAISPRIVIDPSAGVITQYLGRDGDVQAQLPSVTAVAYLRAGLSADGVTPREDGKIA